MRLKPSCCVSALELNKKPSSHARICSYMRVFTVPCLGQRGQKPIPCPVPRHRIPHPPPRTSKLLGETQQIVEIDLRWTTCTVPLKGLETLRDCQLIFERYCTIMSRGNEILLAVSKKDLIFHSFPKDQILRKTCEIKMKRGDKKFASNTALDCCSEHFVETDYRKSLTGARRDLMTNAVPTIFTWSDRNDEVSQRSERARIRGDKTTKPFPGL